VNNNLLGRTDSKTKKVTLQEYKYRQPSWISVLILGKEELYPSCFKMVVEGDCY